MGVFGGLRKFTKKEVIKDAIFAVPPELRGGVFLYGRIGSGKTTGMVSLCQKYHDNPERQYKIVDLYGGERNEHLYWTIPSQDTNYWAKIKKKFRLDEEGPKQYKVNLLFPMTKDLPNKLPQFPPHVHSKIFTIPFKNVNIDDISLSLGVIGNEGTYLWREALESTTKKDSAVRLKQVIRKLNGSNRALYKSFIFPLAREGLLSSEKSILNIDLEEELKDQETISVLCLDFVPKEFKLFVLGWFIRQISDLIDQGKTRRHTIGLIREASEFFRATDQAIVGEEYKIFRRFLSQVVRMGRKGFHLFMDAQSPSETRGMVDGQQDLTILGLLPSEADRQQATAQLVRDNLMTSKQTMDLSILSPGEYYICEVSKKARKRYFFLPRTGYWKPGYGSFYNHIWKNLYDKWISIQDIKDNITLDFERDEAQIKEEERLEALLKEQKKAEKKAKKKDDIEEPEDEEESDDQEEEYPEPNSPIEDIQARPTEEIDKALLKSQHKDESEQSEETKEVTDFKEEFAKLVKDEDKKEEKEDLNTPESIINNKKELKKSKYLDF